MTDTRARAAAEAVATAYLAAARDDLRDDILRLVADAVAQAVKERVISADEQAERYERDAEVLREQIVWLERAVTEQAEEIERLRALMWAKGEEAWSPAIWSELEALGPGGAPREGA